jgi:hypothetical protein
LLGLSISLRVISRTKVRMGSHGLKWPFLELQNNLGFSIKNNPHGYSMETDYPSIGCLDRPEVSYLGQSVHNCPKGIVSRQNPTQSHDEIRSNLFPLSLRYMQNMQHPSRSLILGFNSLTCVAKSNILGNISLNSIPSIGCLEIMVHLIPS